jgi:hypothetical protein
MELLEASFVLCKQGVAGSIPATSTNPFDCKGFTKLFPHLFSLLCTKCAK